MFNVITENCALKFRSGRVLKHGQRRGGGGGGGGVEDEEKEQRKECSREKVNAEMLRF